MKNKNLAYQTFVMSLKPNRFVWYEKAPAGSEVQKEKPKTAQELLSEIGKLVHELERGKKEKDYVVDKLCNAMDQHPDSFSPDLLTVLSERKETAIRVAVAENRRTPEILLINLASDPEARVQAGVACNPHTPENIIVHLAGHPDHFVRYMIAQNPNAPENILVKLADDSNAQVRLNVAANYQTPFDVLVKLADDPSWMVRLEVAHNKHTPADSLAKLAKDRDKTVSEAAREAHNALYILPR
jgi:hypothetical protein